jgi:hypothetical protein
MGTLGRGVHYVPMAHLQTDGARVLSVWHNGGMIGCHHERKRAKRPRDFSQAAKLVVDIPSGQVEDREPTPEEQGKTAAAVARGTKGGRARAMKLTPEQRSEIARLAAQTRWKKSR